MAHQGGFVHDPVVFPGSAFEALTSKSSAELSVDLLQESFEHI